MKQEISKKQWDKLDNVQKLEFWKIVKQKFPTRTHKINSLPNIGQLIDFLGDDGFDLDFTLVRGKVEGNGYISGKTYLDSPELCDVLWQACKHKLQNKDN